MTIALLESLLTTAACTYTLLCDISPWLGQSAKIALGANWLMLAFAGYLFSLQ